MVNRGAQNLLLLSRSGENNESTIQFLKELRSPGIRVEAPSCNICDPISIQHVLDSYLGPAGMAPIRGCVQSSMVLRVRIYVR